MSIHEPVSTRSVGEEQPRSCVAGLPYRFTVDQYHEMIDAGILGENERIELLEGGILHMSPRGPRHVFAVQELAARLAPLLPADWHLRSQDPLTLAESEPEPDLAIVRGARRAYAARHPVAGEVGLVVEVADSSLEFDRSVKQRIYAAAGIPEYWIVNLDQRSIEVYREP
ncbi:MAG TPA: Uma2 family endonuclease, partial [Pirellulales bacterium]|nr:Uma2 family endonuclease [Pirellulales bacterium]